MRMTYLFSLAVKVHGYSLVKETIPIHIILR